MDIEEVVKCLLDALKGTVLYDIYKMKKEAIK